MFKFTTKPSVGIHIKDHVIRFVSMRGSSLANVESFGEKYLPKGVIEKGKIVQADVFEEMMLDCVKKWNLKNKEVMFFVPDSSVFFRKLSIPADIKEEEIRGYLNFEIGASIHLPFDEAYFDYHVLETNEADEKRQILFFATPELLIKDYAKRLESVKLKPIAADISGLSLYRFFQQNSEAGDRDHFLFIEWDVTSINLSIFHDDIPVFMRHIPQILEETDWDVKIGEDHTTLVCKNDVKIDGEISDHILEVERVLNFYKYSMNQGQKEITNIVLTGDHPKLATLIKDRLAEINTNSSLKVIEDLQVELHPHYILPLSLCLKEV
ncbi:type IV pilus biogenesis protein PilM [Evansella cellulosilytica]|uniref:Tfp pilus assembly protein, ATPase PilM n=1 Tax=Evansella cellulosilytica (strain ATCC 21833 / DSM 2522 / FERM P-1141 / JCM 9156 / N-4) TaxID=649639 RepID=E6TZN5_EVAC2|nr:pilus assembly protein PilM [Evansella cellulosilytica]ADU31341.1 Tfp pilus assembly protein, ATPase PilM [Evansella cellulosilytica DSM 2522]